MHVKNLTKFWLLFFLSLTAVSAEELSAVTEKNDLAVALLDRDGQPTAVQGMGGDEGVSEFRFLPTVPAQYQYQSWALEFSGVSTKSNLRISNEGQLPDIIRWNGTFENGNSIQLGKRYFYRLLLIVAGDEIVSSPWVSFETMDRSLPRPFLNHGKILTLAVSPILSFEGAYLKTKSFSYFTPVLAADIAFRFAESQTAGLSTLATADNLFSAPTAAEQMQYSDVELYYRQRILIRDAWFLELGPTLFMSQWRGAGNTAVDAELPRALSGAALSVQGEYRLERWRLVGSFDTGYSLFKGKVFRAAGGMTAFYDGWSGFSPGVQMRYSLWSGTPADDATDGGNDGRTSVTANVLQAGVVMHVRL